MIIRCSDELCAGRQDEHTNVAKYVINNPQARRDFYQFLMARNVPNRPIGKDDLIVTEHQRELNEANRDAIEMFMAALAHAEVKFYRVKDPYDEVPIESDILKATTEQLYVAFEQFCRSSRIDILENPRFTTQLGQKLLSCVTNEKKPT